MKQHLRYVYRIEDADDLPANLALEPYLANLAGGGSDADEKRRSAFQIIEQAQTDARAAGWAGDIWTGEGVSSGPFVSLTPGKLTGGGTGILALYWSVAGEDATYVVSSMLLPYLGKPFRVEEFELRSPGFQHDMTNWAIEKTSDQLQDLLYIKADLARTPQVPEAFKERLMDHLGHLAWNGTKMLAFACGGEWGTDDSKTVLEEDEGIDLLLVKYGRREETRKQERARLLRSLLDDLRLLTSGAVTNLDEVLEILELVDEDEIEEVETLRSLGDEVRKGTSNWEEFSDRVRAVIDRKEPPAP